MTAEASTGSMPPETAPRESFKRSASPWSTRVGTLWGIDIYIHATLVVLLLWVAIARWVAERDLVGTLAALGFLMAVFVSVLLHELGHARMARRLGIRTLKITLSPIGGVASLERLPEEPRHELLIAIAGPIVSITLGLVLAGLAWLTTGDFNLSAANPAAGSFFASLALMNGTLALFNLLPALPLDGGRVFRAVLAMRVGFLRGTEIAATVGQGMALLFGLAGLFLSPMLLLVAYFVWMGAAQESISAHARVALQGLPVEAAMVRHFHTLHPEDPLSTPAALVIDGFQGVFPVVTPAGPVGVLSLADIVRGLAKGGPSTSVGALMNRRFSSVDPNASLAAAMLADQGDGAAQLVVRNGEVVGLLTPENLGELILMRSALRGFQDGKGIDRRAEPAASELLAAR